MVSLDFSSGATVTGTGTGLTPAQAQDLIDNKEGLALANKQIGHRVVIVDEFISGSTLPTSNGVFTFQDLSNPSVVANTDSTQRAQVLALGGQATMEFLNGVYTFLRWEINGNIIAHKTLGNLKLSAGQWVSNTYELNNPLFAMITLPRSVLNITEMAYATPSIFNKYYQLGHNEAPFSGGTEASSEVSTDDSPVGKKYYRYTCLSAISSYILHLNNSTADFNPVINKNYQISYLIRGVGNSIGKQVAIGIFRAAGNGGVASKLVTLPSDWLVVVGDEILHGGAYYNAFIHLSNRGGNMGVGDKLDVAAMYVLQVD